MSYLLRDRHMCVDMHWRQSSADCSGWRGCMAVGLCWVGAGIWAWVALHGGGASAPSTLWPGRDGSDRYDPERRL
eukprot:3434499-Alexandrium_andersonii.AAC.1